MTVKMQYLISLFMDKILLLLTKSRFYENHEYFQKMVKSCQLDYHGIIFFAR